MSRASLRDTMDRMVLEDAAYEGARLSSRVGPALDSVPGSRAHYFNPEAGECPHLMIARGQRSWAFLRNRKRVATSVSDFPCASWCIFSSNAARSSGAHPFTGQS